MKIALCIAGETREYNSFFGPDTLITHLMEAGHTVDIFGHTWDHCEKPIEDMFKFKKLVIEDQLKIVEDWVNKNPEQRLYNEWDHENDCDGPLETIEVTRAKIGQHVSGLKSLQMPETDDYDLFIRWRWDLKIEWNQQWIDKDAVNKPAAIYNADLYSRDYRNTVVKFMYDQWVNYLENRNQIPMVITDSIGWVGLHNWAIQDTHFLLNKLAHKNIKNLNWETEIAQVWNETSKCSSHMLWNHLLIRQAKCMIRQSLPNVTVFTSMKEHKINELYK